MRLWHVDLLPYLPDMQFRGQLRELVAVLHDWRDKGTTNHLLINEVMNYSTADLYEYFRCYEDEWNRRYPKKLKDKYSSEFLYFCDAKFCRYRCYSQWHNKTYLRICMANLYEKFLGVGKNKITQTEWDTLCQGYFKMTGEEYKL